MTDHIIKEIPLTRGKVAIVDAADYEWLSQFRWFYSGNYACRQVQKDKVKRHLFMHQAILNPPPGIRVDHISGNKLDNRRSNLRLATDAENAHNAARRKDSHYIYKGIYRRRALYGARIQVDGKQLHLGYFVRSEAAARAYDYAANQYFGSFARLNFPDEPLWDIERIEAARFVLIGKTSRFVGVAWYKKYQKWNARISVNGRRQFLGYFDSEVDAAKAYNEAALRFHGDNAKVNAL